MNDSTNDSEHPDIIRERLLCEATNDTTFCTCNECKEKQREAEERKKSSADSESAAVQKPKVKLKVLDPATIRNGEVSR